MKGELNKIRRIEKKWGHDVGKAEKVRYGEIRTEHEKARKGRPS
jgi:hypothetical protein